MASACALAMFSGKNIYNFAILENLRIFQNCLFTGGVVEENGICSAAFCESAALRVSVLALSVKALRLCQIPPFVAARHLPPERGKSFLKGRAKSTPGSCLIKPNTSVSRLTAWLPLWGSWRGSA